MANIVDSVKLNMPPPGGNMDTLVQNPIFGELQVALLSDCNQATVPFTLLTGAKTEKELPENFDTVVEDTLLQAEFRQLAPLDNPKVCELENFYNTQSAGIVTQRSDAVAKLHASGLEPDHLQRELRCIGEYYDKQQAHLILRISRSLGLLKCTLPPDSMSIEGLSANKKQKSRLLNTKAVDIMNRWYQNHIDHPYPSDEEKEQLAEEGGISLAQVKSWFANKRNRSLNTKPKRQKSRLQSHLSTICDRLAVTSGGHKGKENISSMMDEISCMVRVTSDRSVLSSLTAYNIPQHVN